jgi:hypothetical protein
MTKTLRSSLGAVPLAIAAMALWPAMASATEGAHFFSDTSASINSSGALVVHIDEAGLGTSEITYLLSAEATATYACINGGGNHPKAANKETFKGPLSTPETSFQPKHGRVQANMPPLGPLSAGSFTCPGGQKLVLAAVSYSNIVLEDENNEVFATSLPAEVSETFFNL